MVVGFMFMYYYFIIAPTEVAVTGDEFAMGKVQANSVMTEILTSPDCLSTGEMGVLSEDKLNETDGTDVLDCAYHPSVWTYVKVKDHDKDKKYEFGDSGLVDISGNIGKKKIPVTIDTGSEKNLGTAILQFIHIPHFFASVTRAGNIAWHEDGKVIHHKTTDYKKYEIDTNQGKNEEDLKIDVEVGDKGITLPFKGYSINASLSFEENPSVSVKKIDYNEPHIEVSGGPKCYDTERTSIDSCQEWCQDEHNMDCGGEYCKGDQAEVWSGSAGSSCIRSTVGCSEEAYSSEDCGEIKCSCKTPNG